MANETMKAIIDRLNREYTQAYNAGQLEAVLDFFASDAITLSPDQAPVCGRDALRRYYQEGFKREPNRNLVLTSIRVDGSGDVLYDAGQWMQSLPTPDGQSQSFKGYYLGVYRNIEGNWKVMANTFNMYQPVPVAPVQTKKG
jgi:uncharacterized protein (TIGR02246 family)